jgi:hypothetical protein
MDRLNAEPSAGKKDFSVFWMTRRHPHRKIMFKQRLDDAPAEKASAAEYDHLASLHRQNPCSMPSCRFRVLPGAELGARHGYIMEAFLYLAKDPDPGERHHGRCASNKTKLNYQWSRDDLWQYACFGGHRGLGVRRRYQHGLPGSALFPAPGQGHPLLFTRESTLCNLGRD